MRVVDEDVDMSNVFAVGTVSHGPQAGGTEAGAEGDGMEDDEELRLAMWLWRQRWRLREESVRLNEEQKEMLRQLVGAEVRIQEWELADLLCSPAMLELDRGLVLNFGSRFRFAPRDQV